MWQNISIEELGSIFLATAVMLLAIMICAVLVIIVFKLALRTWRYVFERD